jgi:hypothetical protein
VLAVLMLRVGDAAAGGLRPDGAAPGTALPLFVDWLHAGTGGVLNRTAVLAKAAAVGGTSRQRACTLAAGTVGGVSLDADGLPSNSADGRLAVWPCYDVPAGSPVGAASPRTVAMLRAGGGVDTRVGGAGSTGGAAGAGTGWRQVVTLDGSALWTASMGATAAGVRYVPQPLTAFDSSVPVVGRGAPGEAAQPGYRDVRALALVRGRDGVLRLWGASSTLDGTGWATLFAVGGPRAPLPTSAAAASAAGGPLPLLGMALSPGTSPWGFVVDPATGGVWLSADHPTSTARGVLQGWAAPGRPGGTWSRVHVVVVAPDPLRSLAARAEGASAAFVVYASSARGVWRYDTATAAGTAAVLLARPPAGTHFRGVMLPPAPGAGSPTPSRTAVKSVPPSPTRSRSLTRSPKRKV